MASVSEYGQCRLFARIRPGTDPASAYNELSSAAFAAYDSMPDAAQRPEIRRGGEDEGPVWIAAFETGAELTADSAPIKRVIAALERLDGVARVDSSGQGSMETLISYDAARAASVGLDAGNIAFSLAADDLLAPGGRVHADGRALALLIDGRFPSAFELESAPIPLPHGSFVCLGEIASIRERAKEPDRISRVNGKGMTTVAVMPSGARSVIALSRAIAGAMHMLKETPGLEMTVLSDDGAEAGKELSRILRAAFFGMAAVALLSGALVAGSRGAFSEPARIMAMASVPFTVLVAAAIVCMSGKNADSYAIAGLAAGLGSAVDAAILSAESMGRAEHKVEALAAFRALRPALLAGCATNVAALLPLRGFETLSPGIVTVALAMGAVNIASLFSSLAIMPPLVLSEGGRRKRKLSCMRRARPRPVGIALRRARRGMAFFSDLCCRFPLWVAALAFALSLAGALALFSMPLSADQDSAGPGVFVHAEFESGTAIGPADQRLAAYARSLLETGSAELVYTSARRGGGSLYAVPVRGNRESLVAAIDSARLEGGLAWLESAGAGKFDWQLVVSGDDDGVCRRIAEDAARLLGNGVSGYDVVLNFKNDHGSAVFRFDAEKAAAAGVPFSRAAAAIRSTVHGPVAYKRSAAGREGDVRVLAVGDSSKEPGAATWADALSVDRKSVV